MNQVRAWLPRQVADRPAIKALIEEAVRRWSDRWFARGRLSVSRMALQPLRPSSQRDNRQLHRTIGLQVRDEALNRIVDLALDAGVSPLAHTQADEILLAGFGEKLLKDLAGEVSLALGIDGQSAPDALAANSPAQDELLIVVGSQGGDDLLALTLPFEALIPACLASLPRPSVQPKPMVSLTTALGAIKVRLKVQAGRARMRLEDLTGLATGDVLVLDRRLEHGVALRIAATDQPVASAQISHLDGQVALIVQAQD